MREWHEYLPYTMSVPVTIGLLWLFVYLKNRANKFSLVMSSQIYDIHYIEGLLKLMNCISRSSNEAMDNISHIVNDMVVSFMEKLKIQNIAENRLTNMEIKELEESPYWKIM